MSTSERSADELVEIIADQACELRELRATVEEQDAIISEYEDDQETDEEFMSLLYADLKDLTGPCAPCLHHAQEQIQEIIDLYFKDFE